MIQCPHCQSSQRQNKDGFTRFGSQRHFCGACQRTYTPHPKHHGCPNTLRQEAVRYSLEGLSQRKVARLLRVSPQSVANWLAQAGEALQKSGLPLVPPELAELCGEIMEQDELYTFCTAKSPGKTPILKAQSVCESASHAQKKSEMNKTTNRDGST